jgi:arylsulfatase A-like enzyme
LDPPHLTSRPGGARARGGRGRELELGQRGHVDYLGLSFSATDLIGHEYGPLSQEQLSNLIELDRTLGELFAFFDAQVGEGRWVAALSADHGVVTAPEAARAMGHAEADRIDSGANGDQLDAALDRARAQGGTPEQIAERAARLLEEQGTVARAYTHQELTHGVAADSFAVLFRNSYYPGRATSSLSRYGIELRYHENDLVRGPTGTTHGSPYWYDRHVPFMLLGAGVSAGLSNEAVYTVDVAPTLAGLAGVAVPYDLDGRARAP